MRFQRALAVCAAAALVVTACGGGDDDASAVGALQPANEPADEPAADEPADPTVPDPTSPEQTVPDQTAPGDAASDGPVSTLSPEIPEEYLVGIAPVDVAGDFLPQYPAEGIPDGGVDAAVGLVPPVLVGLDSEGNPMRIDPATTGPAMLVFLAHWCSHCNNEVPRLNGLRDAGAFPDELNIIGVLTGSRPDAPNWPPTEWIDDMDWTYPSLLDGIDLDLGSFIAYEAYGVGGFPFIVLLNEDGTVAYRWSGEREPDEVIDAISTHLGL